MVAEEQEMMNMDKKDPLIDLKQQELSSERNNYSKIRFI